MGMRRIKPLILLKQRRNFDFWIALFAIFFGLFGILVIYEASNVMAFSSFGNKYYFVKEQLTWFIAGFIGLLVASFVHYKKYYYWSLPLLLTIIIFLTAVFIPGIGVKALGASRWIRVGNINFQPAELAKLSLILYLSAWFSGREKGRLLPFLLLVILVVGLVVFQPDLGTGIILTLIAILLYFFSGAPFWHFLLLLPAVSLVSIGLAISSPYRFGRIMTFLNPNIDPLGTSYHIRQILISLGSGGLFGLGWGASRQKYHFLPEATTDSIFAILGEDFGFIGGSLLIILFIIFLYRIREVAKKSPDKHGFLLASGILVFFASHFVINLGAMVALLPLTGVPLPFLSYGGSNLVVSLAAVGIILNISRHTISHS